MADTSDPLAIALDTLEKARAATGRLYAEIGEVEALRAVAEIAERVANIQRTQLSMQIAAANTITIPQGLTPASRRAWLAAWMEADAAANRLPVIGAAEPTIKRPSVIREGDTIYHDEAGADALRHAAAEDAVLRMSEARLRALIGQILEETATSGTEPKSNPITTFPNPWDAPDFFQHVIIGGRPVKANLTEIDMAPVVDDPKHEGLCKLTFVAVDAAEFDDLRDLYESMRPTPGHEQKQIAIENGYIAYHGFTSCSRKSWDGPRPTATKAMRVVLEIWLQRTPTDTGADAPAKD